MDHEKSPEDRINQIKELLPFDLSGMANGPHLHLSGGNWPQFLDDSIRAIVEERGAEPDDLPPRVGPSSDIVRWCDALAYAGLAYFRRTFAAMPKESDQDGRDEWRRRMRRANLLLENYAGPDGINWPVLLEPTESSREVAAGRWAALSETGAVPQVFEWLAASLEHRGESYRLWFPVVLDWNEKPYLVQAEVTMMASRRPIESSPRVALAPWSLIRRDETEILSLEKSLEALARVRSDCATFLGGRDILLELMPVDHPELRPPLGGLITEDSLGLAVVMSCWASTRRPMLRRMVLTGEIEPHHVKKISYLNKKYDAVKMFADFTGRRTIFLVPLDSAVECVLKHDPRVRIEAVDRWESVFALAEKLLTDGFDGYRGLLASAPDRLEPLIEEGEEDDFGRWIRDDQVELDGLVDRLLADDPPRFDRIALPFGNDPEVAARYVVESLCRRVREESNSGRRFAQETSIPALAPLSASHEASGLGPAVLTGFRSWKSSGLRRAEAEDWPSESQVLSTTRVFPHLFLLVLYSDESRKMKSLESEMARVERLFDEFRDSTGPRPRVVLIASDLHHLERLEAILREVASHARTDDSSPI